VNAQQELSFDQIIAGIKEQKAVMAELQPQIDAVTASMNAQQTVVNNVTAARDQIQASYDAEYAKLQMLQDAYSKTEDMIRSMESALRDLASAANDAIQRASAAAQAAANAKDSLSPGAENFLAAEGANFPEVGGQNPIGREGGMGDQSALIDQFTKDIEDEVTKAFGDLDLFGPIKEQWNKFTAWLQENVWSKLGGVWESIKTGFSDTWAAISDSSAAQTLSSVWNTIADAASTVWGFLTDLWDLFKDDFKQIVDSVVEAGRGIWEKIGPELEKFKPILPKIGKLFSELWTILKPIVGFIGVVLVGAFKIVTSVIAHVLTPVLDTLIDVFKNIIRIVRDVIDFFVSLFTGDFSGALKALGDMIGALWDGIFAIFKGAWDIIYGLVEGIVEGVIDWFKWLYDKLIGHSIIPDMINGIIEWFKSLPGKVWDAIISLKDKVVDVAIKMWDAFTKKSSELWNAFINWIKGLPQNTWNSIIAIKDKLFDVASKAWEAFKKSSSDKWTTFINWVKGLPQAVWNSIIAIKDKLWQAAKDGFQALKDKAVDMVEGKNGFIAWIKGLPQKIADGLKTIGSKVADGIKIAWNAAAQWINDNGIKNINKVTTHFGFELKPLPKFASGGVIPGQESKKDNMLILARSGEGIIVPELVKHLGGAMGLARANQAAKTGNARALGALGIPGYEDGGVVGAIKGWIQHGTGWALSHAIDAIGAAVKWVIPGEPFAEKWMVGAMKDWSARAKAWGDLQGDLGNDALPGRGYQFQIAALHNAFPNAVVTSSFRPGAITWAGTQSMHGAGRAIDIAPRKDVFEWIRRVYGKRTQELFWSPEDGRNIRFGKDWKMDPTTKAGHWDHIHWGYDKGGILPPGLTLAKNGTGRDEMTLTGAQFDALSNVVALLASITQKSAMAGTPGAAAVARVGATLATVEGRLRSMDSSSPVRSNGGGDTTTLNFYGDLEFPNITDGNDAEEFVKNLRGLAG
ncbi:MAG TPA: hypothetical protein VIY48_12605, partial [Candidatus Paceibacterota bacterium]